MFAVQNGVVTYNGTPTNNLSPEQIRRMYGSVGNILGANERDNPDMFEDVVVGYGDAGQQTERRVRQDLQNRLYRDGQWYRQVGPVRSIGGEGEVSDLNGIKWDDELGFITPMSNVREYDDTVFTPGMLLAAGGMLGAIGMAGGFSGLGIGGAAAEGAATTGGFPAGAGLAGPSLETAGMATGALEGAAGAGAGVGAGASGFPAGAGIAGPTLETAGMATNVPWYTQALANAGVNLTNPMMVARGLLGASSLLNSLKPSGGGSDAPGGGDLTPANVPRFNPAGLLANYRAPTFDPVPFMSGKYGLLGS